MNKAIYQSLDDYASRRKSRREFIRTVFALGVTPLAAESWGTCSRIARR